MLKFINLTEIIIDFINNDEAVKSISCDYDVEGKPSFTFNFRNGYKVCFYKPEKMITIYSDFKPMVWITNMMIMNTTTPKPLVL